MKNFLRLAGLLALTVAFLWCAYAAGRNWFLYATMFGGTVGHSRIDSNLNSIHRLETQWYFAMVICLVLALGSATFFVLRVLKLLKGTPPEDAEESGAE